MERLGQGRHLGHAVTRPVPCDDQRPLGPGDAGDRPIDRTPRRGNGGRRQAALGASRAGAAGVEYLHLVGQDEVRDVAFDERVLHGQGGEFGRVAAGQDGLAEAGHRLEGGGQIDVLEGAGAHHLGLHLAGQGDDRRAVHLGVPETGEQVRRARAGDGEAGGRPAGHLGVARAGEGGRTLVADAEIAQLSAFSLDAERFSHAQVGVPDHAEDGVQTPLHQGLGDDVAECPVRAFRFGQRDLDLAVLLAHLQGLDRVLVAPAPAGLELEVVAVPGTAERALADIALTQRSALVRAAAVEGEEFAALADQGHLLLADGKGADLPLGEVRRLAGRNPGLLSGFARPGRRGDGQRLVVVEAGVPVASVAERLVPGRAAAAEHVVLKARALAEPGVLQLDPAADAERAVARHLDLGRPVEIGVQLSVFHVAERAGGTLADGLDDGRLVRAVGIDPGFGRAPDRGQAGGAVAGVGTDAAVVEDGDLAAFIPIELVGNAVVRFGIGEACPDVRAVAERLVARVAAAAEEDGLPGLDRFPARVVEGGQAGDLERSVFSRLDGDAGGAGWFRLLPGHGRRLRRPRSSGRRR